jgi:glycosyltransferase involved in cell wall biosynthesis
MAKTLVEGFVALRVLFLAERYPPDVAGGGELSASLVAKAVNEVPGVEVKVLTQGEGNVGEVGGVPVHYTLSKGSESLPDDLTRSELLTARAALAVAKELKQWDMVHSVSPRTISAATAAAKLARKPATSVMNDTWATCFTHSHIRRGEYCPTCFPGGLKECLKDIGGNVKASPIIWRQFKRRLKAVNSLNGIVAISPTIEKLLKGHKVTVPIITIPQPLDMVAWDGPVHVNPDPGTVAFIARMAPGKGVIESLDAFATAAEDRPEARLVMVGDGPLIDEARKRVDTLGLSERVEFKGWVPPEELPDLMRGVQVVLAPFMRVEAMGRVILEAAAAHRPVVTTDLGGATGLLHTKPGAGRVVKWNDTKAWSVALGELLDDPKGCVLMGAEAYRRLKDLYGPKGFGATYVDFFKSVL